jgi:flagellar motility protein MotE (MotC chaperone)
VGPNTTLALPPAPAPKVCAPTPAELAKQAGMSPAELQVLQNLGARRGELDQRESDLETQLALLAAAEAKLDAKAKALTGLKADVQNLLTQADGREAAEVDRLVKVFETMKPKDAAPRMTLLEDSVRLPIAAKMKPRILSAVIAQMSPSEAKKLTESLAKRFAAAQTLAQNAIAQADPATPAAGSAAADAAKAKPAPVKQQAKARPRKKAPAAKQASADKAPAADAAPAAAAPAAPPAAPPAPKAG